MGNTNLIILPHHVTELILPIQVRLKSPAAIWSVKSTPALFPSQLLMIAQVKW